MCACLVLAVVVENMKRIRNLGIKELDWVQNLPAVGQCRHHAHQFMSLQ